MKCRHYECRCARAAELAAMGLIVQAIDVHQQEVTCRQRLVPGEYAAPAKTEGER
jgi:hypothetical protein